MIKPKPFSIAMPLKAISLTALILGISACTPPPVKDAPVNKTEKQPPIKQVEIRLEDKVKTLSIAELEKLRNSASMQNRWADYLIYSTQIWHKNANQPAIQEQIENQAWSIINALSSANIQALDNSKNTDVQSWVSLYQAFNGSKYEFDTALLNLQTFESNAIYQNALLQKLIDAKPAPKTINQIAVLLPLEGKYKVVGNQIRSGIMKAFFASNQDIIIKFYDTSQLENVETVYNQAKAEGADRIIGPLRKEAIQLIASFHDDSMLALNTIENSSITQFSFKSANQSLQMAQRFQKSGFKRIGILTNDNPRTLAYANELKQTLNKFNHSAELSAYPDENPRLREALGNLIHEKNSKERQNNLRWLIGEKLEFFPRTREDLDAIVIFDNAHRMAVFRPQFDFFELATPLYGDTELTPRNFQDIQENRDLKQVSFLTYPATLDAADLTSAFEAFGWDSFQVTLQLDNLHNGSCLTSAKTGILSLEGNEIKQQLVWATYDKKGQLTYAPAIETKTVVSELSRNSDNE